jgi:hypothetical protein
MLDLLARVFAVAAFIALPVAAWVRRRQPATALVCFSAFAMVAIPVLAVARPSNSVSMSLPGPHHLINLAPPLLLGIAALAALPRPFSQLITAAATMLAGAQILLAIPFFLTIHEYWPQNDYGVPWAYTRDLVAVVHDEATAAHAPVYVGGDGENEQQLLPARLLALEYQDVRLNDGRDGFLYWADRDRVVLATTDDTHTGARFLRDTFPAAEVLAQRLDGSGWTRRAFTLSHAEIEQWLARRLQPVSTDQPGSGLLHYDGAAVLPSTSGPPMLAVAWHFQRDPSEAVFTDFELQQGGCSLLQERHLAYPAPFLQPGDWRRMRIVNLFNLAAATGDPLAADSVTFFHDGLHSGRAIAPPIQVPLGR